jgi:ubiquinol-cytochrome c reductase cytochrome c subunit
MHMKKLMLISFVVFAASTIGAQTNAPAPATPKGDATNGKKLFVSYGCYQCHGYEGQGSTATGPRLAPRPIPFAAFSKQLRKPSSEMPPYTAKVATDAQLADIYAFLQSVPAPKDPDTIPLLKN